MKMQFAYTGDVHSFVMAMMQGLSFDLTGEKRSLVVEPNLKKEGFSIKKGTTNQEMIMTIPVTLAEFGGEALMSFQYDIKSVEVANAVAPVEEVVGDTTMPDDNGNCLTSEQSLSRPYVASRPAIKGRPAVKATLFQRGIREYNSMLIKFE